MQFLARLAINCKRVTVRVGVRATERAGVRMEAEVETRVVVVALMCVALVCVAW